MTSIDELVIDRSNFQQNRRAYGITLAEIADKCKISSSVISNFENFTGKYTQTRVRDDNQRTIVRALKDLIQEKIDSVFYISEQKVNNNNKEKENETMNEAVKEITLTELAQSAVKENSIETKPKKNKGGNNYVLIGYKKGPVIEKLRDYCKRNDLKLGEFCDMCGVNRSTLAPYSIKVAPVLREDILVKICKATGIDINMFNEDRNDGRQITSTNNTNNVMCNTNIVPIKEKKPIEVPKLKDNSHKTEVKVDTGIEIRDKKYTFQDGVFYEEYVEIRHVKHSISKEQFLNAIQ